MCAELRSVAFRKTLIATPYGLRTIGREGVSPGGGISISSGSLSYLLALYRTLSLSERAPSNEKNRAQ